jgi:hypothetical protein
MMLRTALATTRPHGWDTIDTSTDDTPPLLPTPTPDAWADATDAHDDVMSFAFESGARLFD